MDRARTAALHALLQVDENEGYSNLVLDKTIGKFSLSPRDAAFSSALFYGVLERRLTLDYALGCFSNTPVERLSPQVREILRLGAYQLLFLDRVPDSAAAAVSSWALLEADWGEQAPKAPMLATPSAPTPAPFKKLLRENEPICHPFLSQRLARGAPHACCAPRAT